MSFIQILLLAILSASAVSLENRQCCASDLEIYMDSEGYNSCWDTKLDVFSPISMSCNETVLIPDDAFNFTQESLDEIEANEPGSFCIFEGNVTKVNITEHLRVFAACIEEEETPYFSYCLIVSVVFLAATALVYVCLPEMRDLQGKSIINLCISLAIGYAILAGMNLFDYSDMNLCAARGFFAYFFILVGFFWSNAISIQIVLSLRRPMQTNYGWKEISWYALYAWGCPALLTICMAIVNYHPGDHPKPGIGFSMCWFSDKKQQWYYMYSVMLILILANICIFLYTSVQLWRQTFASSHVKALKYKFLVTVRMVVIMGLTWVFEVISSLFKSNFAWAIMDILNALQGLLIFLLLVVFRRRVVKALWKRGLLDCAASPVEKYLAAEEDQEDVVQHTMDVPMDDRPT